MIFFDVENYNLNEYATFYSKCEFYGFGNILHADEFAMRRFYKHEFGGCDWAFFCMKVMIMCTLYSKPCSIVQLLTFIQEGMSPEHF